MLQVLSTVTTKYNYILLTLSTTSAIRVEYFEQYPDLKMDVLEGSPFTTLKNNGIAGYALCQDQSGVWVPLSIRAATPVDLSLLQTYIKMTLNNSYTISAPKGGDTL